MGHTKEFLDVEEVSQRLRISRSRAYALISQGLIPHVRRGRRILVPARSWAAWVESEAERAMGSVAR